MTGVVEVVKHQLACLHGERRSQSQVLEIEQRQVFTRVCLCCCGRITRGRCCSSDIRYNISGVLQSHPPPLRRGTICQPRDRAVCHLSLRTDIWHYTFALAETDLASTLKHEEPHPPTHAQQMLQTPAILEVKLRTISSIQRLNTSFTPHDGHTDDPGL